MSDEMTQPSTEAEQTQTEPTVVNGEGEATNVTTYVDGKFDSVSALEKSYTELQSSYSKKLGGFDGAPEGGYALEEGAEANDRITKLQEWGAENSLNQDAFNALIAMDTEARAAEEAAFQEQEKAYVQEQIGLLGDNGKERVQNISDWAKANLGEDGEALIKGAADSAKAVEVIEKLIGMTKGTAPAPAQQASKVDGEQLKAMRFATDEFGNRKMSSDPAYRAKVEALEQEVFTQRN